MRDPCWAYQQNKDNPIQQGRNEDPHPKPQLLNGQKPKSHQILNFNPKPAAKTKGLERILMSQGSMGGPVQELGGSDMRFGFWGLDLGVSGLQTFQAVVISFNSSGLAEACCM